MPSPFPGMDPFIEGHVWEDFHHRLVDEIAVAITPRLRPRYVARVEVQVYLEHEPEERRSIIPDAYVAGTGTPGPPAGGVGAAVAPVRLTLPIPVEMRRAFLTIRDRDNLEVVTEIEMLSPWNKRPHSDGVREYVRKREAVLRDTAHLVELDMLRRGDRRQTGEPLPPGDFYALVSRAKSRPTVDVYPWALRHPLPTIPIPLAGSDPDVPLDLQAVFTSVYDRAGYDYSLDYSRPVEPPLSPEDVSWVHEVLGGAHRP